MSKGTSTLSGISIIDGSMKEGQTGRHIHFATLRVQCTTDDGGESYTLTKKVNGETITFEIKAFNAAMANTSEVVSLQVVKGKTEVKVKLYSRMPSSKVQQRIAKGEKYRAEFLRTIGATTGTTTPKPTGVGQREKVQLREQRMPAGWHLTTG